MDVICCVLKTLVVLNEKEEVIKKKIKKCVDESKDLLVNISNHDVNFSKVYLKMEVNHFGHVLAFYSMLETYFETNNNKTKEEKKI